ncbi:MAG: hypothetical protein JEZ09_07880 [Salinivirgaceae bacterium]|nr:hypothetical protein [Salinivirgaceae bacterium]
MNKIACKTAIILLIFTTLYSCNENKLGCTDKRAINFDIDATVDNGLCEYDFKYYIDISEADAIGNLFVNNNTNSILYLYADNVHLKTIDIGVENYLVNVNTTSVSKTILKVCKAQDVEDVLSPSSFSVFSNWNVNLPSTGVIETAAIWNISNADPFEMGTIVLSYPNKDNLNIENIYDVKIHLNSKTGTIISSLPPGISDKKISLGIINFTLYYNYLYFDENSNSLIDVGWDNSSELTINENNDIVEIDIPSIYSIIGRSGDLNILNQSSYTITVYADGELIENSVSVTGSTDGISQIEPFESYVYELPIKSFNIEIQSNSGNELFSNVYVFPDKEIKLSIGSTFKEVTISNLSNNTLLFFDQDSGDYLGLKVDAQTTINDYKVMNGLSTFKIFNLELNQYFYIDYTDFITIN